MLFCKGLYLPYYIVVKCSRTLSLSIVLTTALLQFDEIKLDSARVWSRNCLSCQLQVVIRYRNILKS